MKFIFIILSIVVAYIAMIVTKYFNGSEFLQGFISGSACQFVWRIYDLIKSEDDTF